MVVVGHVLVLYVVLSTGGLSYWHHAENGVFDATCTSLFFFCALNTLICLWEMALGANISKIERDYRELRETYKGRALEGVLAFFMTPVGAGDLFSGAFWSRVWSTYSLYDPSYQNRESFGFFIDVGNGWSSVLPSVLFPVAMVRGLPLGIGPQAVGLVAICSFWQMFYGTVVYFLSFFFNGRYRGLHWGEVAGFVGVSNGLWFFFPLLGIYASARIVLDNDYSVFGR